MNLRELDLAYIKDMDQMGVWGQPLLAELTKLEVHQMLSFPKFLCPLLLSQHITQLEALLFAEFSLASIKIRLDAWRDCFNVSLSSVQPLLT